MGKTRITIEVLASGQPRAYADHELRVRVQYEWTGWEVVDRPFEPLYKNSKQVQTQIEKLDIGFITKTHSEAPWPNSYLDFLRSVDPQPDEQASIWEFQVTTPYVD